MCQWLLHNLLYLVSPPPPTSSAASSAIGTSTFSSETVTTSSGIDAALSESWIMWISVTIYRFWILYLALYLVTWFWSNRCSTISSSYTGTLYFSNTLNTPLSFVTYFSNVKKSHSCRIFTLSRLSQLFSFVCLMMCHHNDLVALAWTFCHTWNP